jgi:2-polyprenyl-6-methoxyphenol hydroxylase-like FAD-dependent oxidoreductase
VRVVVVGGGMAGMALARALMRRGTTPVVLERLTEEMRVPGPIMLPYQAYDALEDIGLLGRIRDGGWDIAPRPDGTPVAISVARQLILDLLGRQLAVERGQKVLALTRDGGRVTGVHIRGPEGERQIAADLVVGADGTHSRVRDLAGISCRTRPSPGAGLSFQSPVVIDRSFAMAYQSDGRQVGLLGWPEGSAGWWQIDRIGRGAALAPGVEAFKRAFLRLLPAAERALEGVTEPDQLVYREVTEVRCETWWVSGVVVIGEAAHAIDPEAGIGSGLGFGDALALAVAIERNEDPDAACRDYEHWRRPAVAPYEAVGAAGARMPTLPPGAERPPWERWPPIEDPEAVPR